MSRIQQTSSFDFAVLPQPKLVRARTAGAIISSPESRQPISPGDLDEGIANLAATVVINRDGADIDIPSERRRVQEEAIAIVATAICTVLDRVQEQAAAAVAAVVATVLERDFSWKCCICLEQQSGAEPRQTGLCGDHACSETFCHTCLEAYFSHAASYSRFTVLPVRCPAERCGRRVPTERWARLAPSQSFQEYEKGARNSLNYRCPSCHEADSLLVDCVVDQECRAHAVEEFLAQNRRSSFSAERLLRRCWAAFSIGTATADEVLDALLTVLGCHSILDLQARLFRQALGLIPDIERRCALHLACIRRHPLIWTPCCGVAVCLRCQIAGHHEGMTCEEVQRQELEVECQFCPSCGVPTQKTEGCDHIICLCGENWEWQQAPEAAEDWVAPAADDWAAPAGDDWAAPNNAANAW